MTITVLPGNQAKQIASLDFVRATTSAGFPNIMGVVVNSPCTGTPTVGTISPAGPLTTCNGAGTLLVPSGNSAGPDIGFQWEESTDGGVTWNPAFGPDTNANYLAVPIVNTEYRLIVTCKPSAGIALSPNISFTVPAATFAPIPFFEDFDTWANSCAVNDVPAGGNWVTGPALGNDSWRRNNLTTSWTTATGAYTPGGVSTSLPPGPPAPQLTSARFHSSLAGSTSGSGSLNLFLNCGLPLGDKQLYFYHLNGASAAAGIGTDSLNIWLSVNGGLTFSQIAGFDTAATWRRRTVAIPTNSPQTIIRFEAKRIGTTVTDIGIDSVYIALPCTGAPAAGSISNLPASGIGCAGASYTLSTIGTTMAGGLGYQWQQSTDGGATWVNAIGGSGATTEFYTTPPLYDTIQYQVIVNCLASASSATTPAATINVLSPKYTTIPYFQNFENWDYRCSASPNTSIPDTFWAQSYNTGNNNTWRRNDQGASGGWTLPNNGAYSPLFVSGTKSARYHSSQSPLPTMGSLDLLVNCSQQAGNKQLEFHYINPGGSDSLEIFYSVDSGFTFTSLKSYRVATSWTEDRIPLPSNSAKTVIRFTGSSDFGTTGTDIGIDSVRIVEPCTGAVTAGLINNLTDACKNVPFLLYLTGNTQTAGLTYDWQSSPDNATWTSIVGGTSFNLTTTITQPTFFRAKVTCVVSGQFDITPSQLVDTTAFYYCYCSSGATAIAGADVGNVTLASLPGNVVKLNKGTGTPLINNGQSNKTYTDNRSDPATIIFHDSSYRIAVVQINNGAYNPATISAWIDLNHNAIFDPNELVLQKATSVSSSPAQQEADTFLVPNTVDTGLTGLRVIVEQGTTPSLNPCGAYTNGETEDYLVRIWYPPCDGPANAGVAEISDTSACVGYTVFVTDTTYEKVHSYIERKWQESPDGVSWADIAGSDTLDQLAYIVSAKVYFRMRLVCVNPIKRDTTYSNVVSASINPPVYCYCMSQAIGGKPKDSSDIGAFLFESFTNNVGGPHLKNPLAGRMRTDYTRQLPSELWIDSTYTFSLYHIMRSPTHADAKVTIFIDFDADMQYDIPQELVYTGYTSANNFTITGNLTVASNALPDLLTGMRVILNNDVAPNLPSDEGCGVYESGETEDYVVIIRSPLTSVNTISNISHYTLFPNPTDGRFTVSYTTQKSLEDATVTITNVVGTKIYEQHYGRRQGSTTFHEELDLSDMASGVYFVELKADNQKMIRKIVIQ
jgi:hypothetical protein